MYKKYFVDMGSSATKIYTNILLLKQPSLVIVKKGLKKAVAAGDDALRMTDLDQNQMLIAPISDGAVMHFNACVLMIKEYFSRLRIKKSAEIVVFFSCGLNSEKKRDLERVFIEAGYCNIILQESLQKLKPYVATYGNMVVADIGHSQTDVGIINEDGVVLAYNLNLGLATLDNRIINTAERLFKIKISSDTAEKIKFAVASLHENDNTKISVTGRDIITSRPRVVEISSKDIYEDVLHCYLRIIKVMEGSLVVAPLECIEGISQRGIFVMGGGAKVEGLTILFFRD